MCGITAIINTKDSDESLIISMLDKIKHRGDTQPNYEKIGNNLLGNVRLKIVDIDNGKQPFYNGDHSIGVVFNGEVYNYKELRTDLIEKGYKFYTDCDTEVLPYLYEEYGVKFLSMLDGMFAFVLIDLKSNSHFFARDRFGIKPLYYCLNNETIYISSELKSFEKVDTADFKELAPACYYYNGEIEKYSILKYDIDYSIDFNEAVESIKHLLVSAVKKRVQTDLPIGIFLSGGIDSSIVFYLALQFHKNIIPIIVGKENSEDFIAASKLCNYFEVEYVHINPSEEEILNTIPKIVKCIETFEPNPIRGSALTYFLAKKAKELGLKIVLCGEGSDEVFGGYGDFFNVQNDIEFQILSKSLIEDLHRTQLLRIDRIGMWFSIEIREPFMDNALIDFALKLSSKYKTDYLKKNTLTKIILREAFKKELPDFILNRVKKTLMEGAGANSLEVGKGMFFSNAVKTITKEQLIKTVEENKEYSLRNEEEVLYYCYFQKFYSKFLKAQSRTFNAKNELYAN